MSNKTVVLGRLGSEPESKMVGDNLLVSFSFAEKIYQGAEKDALTQWYDIELWGEKKAKIAPNLKKGQMVQIIGTFIAKPYLKKDGTAGVSLLIKNPEIQFTDSKPE